MSRFEDFYFFGFSPLQPFLFLRDNRRAARVDFNRGKNSRYEFWPFYSLLLLTFEQLVLGQ